MIGGHMKSSEMFRLSSLIVLWSVSIIGQAKTLQESNWIQATDGILAEAVALVKRQTLSDDGCNAADAVPLDGNPAKLSPLAADTPGSQYSVRSDRPFPMTDVTQQMQCLLTAIPPNLVHLRQTLPVHNILSEA